MSHLVARPRVIRRHVLSRFACDDVNSGRLGAQ